MHADFKKWLIQAGICKENEIKGVAEAEIKSLEATFSVTLPGSYKDFLRQCGVSAGVFCQDVDFFYDEIVRLKDDFTDALDEWNKTFRPPEKAFVFSAYQGGSYHYFVCDGNDNPPIYVFYEENLEPVIVAAEFIEYMKKYISAHQGQRGQV
ncbi:SMI1/KNR4 family protein [Undibacterium pigrum]|uniref:SUKH superfamily protein n=1 Tax=Undibacterium pigrum TaxID=401470 RepID=A0A318JHT6_9BURK|nr:SMI1/KNR4 family protein [Undibacterium pigrum]PXX46782.1 SUKH superfamily protein [Undibacterium pigrum]